MTEFDPNKPIFKQKIVGETEVELPCGLLLGGTLHKTAMVTPIMVKDRKDAMDPSRKRNGAKIVSHLLESRVTRIGEISPVGPLHSKSLLAGDREFLLLKLYEVSNPGKPLTAQFKCSHCKADVEVEIPMEEISILQMPEDAQNDTTGAVRTFKVDLPDWEVSAVFKYPNGEMQEAVAPLIDTNPAEGELMLFRKMLVSWNGGPPLTEIQFDTLPIGLISGLEKAMMEKSFGPDLRKKLLCGNCGETSFTGLNIANFLFRS